MKQGESKQPTATLAPELRDALRGLNRKQRAEAVRLLRRESSEPICSVCLRQSPRPTTPEQVLAQAIRKLDRVTRDLAASVTPDRGVIAKLRTSTPEFAITCLRALASAHLSDDDAARAVAFFKRLLREGSAS